MCVAQAVASKWSRALMKGFNGVSTYMPSKNSLDVQYRRRPLLLIG
jgi:hypothetical protein